MHFYCRKMDIFSFPRLSRKEHYFLYFLFLSSFSCSVCGGKDLWREDGEPRLSLTSPVFAPPPLSSPPFDERAQGGKTKAEGGKGLFSSPGLAGLRLPSSSSSAAALAPDREEEATPTSSGGEDRILPDRRHETFPYSIKSFFPRRAELF